MCSKPKVPSVTKTEVIKTAVRADASTQKANSNNRSGVKGLISENIKTSNNGLTDDFSASKKKLLGE